MKKYMTLTRTVFIAAFLFCIGAETLKAQETTPDTSIFIEVEKTPEFPGGEEARHRFLQENLRYPLEALEKGWEGRVVVEFVIEPDGTLTNFRVIRGAPGASILDEEALRVVKLMPNWIPGIQRGKAVRVRHLIPITFTLHNKKNTGKKK